MKFFTHLLLFLLCAATVQAQEICNNGIDDDFDGLIDCYDPDCCGDTSCSGFYYLACLDTSSNTCVIDSISGIFSMQETWRGTETISNYVNPVVGDLDGDQIPEIVAIKRSATSNGLVIFNSQTGAVKSYINMSTTGTTDGSGLVLADMDSDGQPEIVVPRAGSVVCYKPDGTLVWSSPTGLTGTRSALATVADINHDGRPEVLVRNHLLNGQTGALMGSFSGSFGNTGGTPNIINAGFSVLADILPNAFCIDCTGLEIVAGNTVYTVDIDTNTNIATIAPQVIMSSEPDGLTSIADWDNDGDLDGIITHVVGNAGRLYVWDLQTPTLLMTTGTVSRAGSTCTIGVGGSTVADLDKDNQLEAIFVLNQRLVVIENDGSIKWSITNSDCSGITGITVYDFDGNGQYELVYRDQSQLQVFDANTGTLLQALPCASLTQLEYPIVADIDGDQQTEILCTCGSGATGYITAFESSRLPWVTARPLWNQYQYFSTNINDDLSVPLDQQAHHLVGDNIELNSFRKQYQATGTFPLADAVLQITGLTSITSDSMEVTIQICNQGDVALSSSTPIVFYDLDPTLSLSATPVDTILQIGQNIETGNCIMQTYTIPYNRDTLYAVINDDGSLLPVYDLSTDFPLTTIGECDYTNNLSAFFIVEICGNGLDDDGDGLIDCYDPDCCGDSNCNSNTASKAGNIWYFGVNAGLDFNTNPPTELTNGQLVNMEGCASIADSNGQLLFYTNGIDVWDRSHNIMLNGSGLLGHPSATQSAVIVPQPRNQNIYYIFTVDYYQGNNGLRYSVVDMSLNGGLGGVTATKNVLLIANSPEKITAVRHANNEDYWVIAHEWGSQNYHVYQLTSAGLNTTPNIQAIGTSYTGSTLGKIGYLKAAANGKRIAVAIRFPTNIVDVFDFDNATGTLSNHFTISQPNWGRSYGIEFSPNGDLLYVSILGTDPAQPALLEQYDLSSGVPATIIASRVVLSTEVGNHIYGALQLAPDGKIYMARSADIFLGINFLDAIDNPNIQGVGCNYTSPSITLTGGRLSRIGLPNIVQSSVANPEITVVGQDTICVHLDSAMYSLTHNIAGADSIVWAITGGNTIRASTDTSATLNITATGTDSLFAIVYQTCNSYTDTFVIYIDPCIEICDNGIDDDGDGLIDCYDPDCCENTDCDGNYYTICDSIHDCQIDSFESNFGLQQLWQNSTSINNITIPVVGDIDNDGIPDAVATKRLAASNALLIFDTQTGTIKQTINTSTGGDNTYNSGIALADIDNDGNAEIIYPSGNHFIYCYKPDGTLLWTSSQAVTTAWATIASVADFNHDGFAEVYAGAYLLNGQDGTVMGTLSGSYGHTGGQPGIGDFANPVAVDALPDSLCIDCGGLEIVAGNTVYTVNINTATNTAIINAEVTIPTEPDGLTSVADWNKDGVLDGIITHTVGNQARLYVWNLQTGALIGTTGNVSRGGSSGTIGVSTATVADIDNDGLLESSFVLNQRLLMVENNFSIKWSVSNSDVSGSTGTTLYDFDGNGDYELVYRDETLLRIFDAVTGTIEASIPCTSGTGTERPIVADIDADGQTEILCTCNGFVDGHLTAFGSNGAPWMPARKIWNQYQYFAVNINDDLSVPQYQQQHHIVGDSLELNSFLKQYQRNDAAPVPDAALQIVALDSNGVDSTLVQVEICNLGDNTLSASTPISFYNDNPTAVATATLIAPIYSLGQNLEPGACDTFSYSVFGQSGALFGVVNCDNSILPIYDLATDFPMTNIGECTYLNNIDNDIILLNEDLLRFEANKVGKTALLDWKLSENHTYTKIILQRSADGYQFEAMDKAFMPMSQQYSDEDPLAGDNYYRLQLYKANGSMDLSPVRQLNFKNEQPVLTIYPNPTQDILNIKLQTQQDEPWRLQVYDLLGRILIDKQGIDTKHQLNTANLPAGSYILILSNSTHTAIQRKFVKK